MKRRGCTATILDATLLPAIWFQGAAEGYTATMMKNALAEGLVAGTVGVIAMTAGEKIEQTFTGRPNSHVPGRVLARLTGGSESAGAESTALNWAMHFGQGMALGMLRSIMAEVGLRGPLSSAKFTVVRLTNDQIFENATGVGAPPQTWPRAELALDFFHKTVYAFATGAVSDALAARRGPGPGQLHAAAATGRHPDGAPVPRSSAWGR